MNKILVVDDEASMRMLYADELAEEGYEVITHGESRGILDLIKRETPDLILLDIRLGEHSGLDILQDMRNTYYDLPIILCTACSDLKYDLKSPAADYYVVKSSSLEGLKRKIRMALETEATLTPTGAPQDR